jgi:pilus assembly protein Flp/PilA
MTCATKTFYSRFLLDETGATAIEYGLIATLICVVIIGAVQSLSNTVKTTLWDVVAAMMAP